MFDTVKRLIFTNNLSPNLLSKVELFKNLVNIHYCFKKKKKSKSILNNSQALLLVELLAFLHFHKKHILGPML